MFKVVKRTPHIITSKVGMAKSSNDAEIDDLKRRFTAVEEESAKLLKDSKSYRDAVSKMLSSSHDFGQAYITLLSPMSNELDLAERYPSASKTIEQMSAYQELITDLRDTVQPELDLIDSRITAPIKEYLEILKRVRKAITKRDHKLIDFDRHNNAYTKLRDKKDKTLKDEQNIFKVEQDYEAALAEYEHHNNLLRTEIPRFLELTTSFVSPLFHSFFYIQLNIIYRTFEKLQQFSEGRFDFSQTDLEAVFLAKLDDANERIGALSITKRPTSTAKIMAERRLANGETPPYRASASASHRPPPSISSKPSTSSFKTASRPPPLAAKPSLAPPSLTPKPSLASKPSFGSTPSKSPFKVESPPSAVPPPYTPEATSAGIGSVAAAAAAIQSQRNLTGASSGPPVPKPKPTPPAQTVFVTALYDFAAQAAGDLSFSAGDRIELLKRTDSEEDWWTGRLNGVEGIFPGNYVQL